MTTDFRERRVMTRLPNDDVRFLERIAPRRASRADRGGVSELIAHLLRPEIARLRRQHADDLADQTGVIS